MRFALLGNHPDGVELARALVESGRQQLLVYTHPLPSWAAEAQGVNDLEEVLADPAVEVVIVASSLDNRAAHLRRALQSERHVLCVWPPDDTPDIAYEASLIQKDTGCLLLPILTEGLHPAVRRLASLLDTADETGPLGRLRFLELERSEPGPVLLNTGLDGLKPSFPGWDLLGRIGGEIAEISAFAGPEEVPEDEPVLVAGRFQRGGLFQETLLPDRVEARCRLTVQATQGEAELLFPAGLQGQAALRWQTYGGKRDEESWPPWRAGPTLVEAFESALPRDAAPTPPQSRPSPTAIQEAQIPEIRTAIPGVPGATGETAMLDWQDAIRGAELDDAARRSIEKRRSSTLEYPEASEEVGFKGTMTLVGCGVLWAVILMLFLARWAPWLGVVIFVLLGLFLALQLFRFLIPRKPQ